MNNQSKISIRFFNDHEVRALWDDQNAKWWFSVLDIVVVLNEESDYTKTRNYWKYGKTKLKKENNQLVSATTQLKLRASLKKTMKWLVSLPRSNFWHQMAKGVWPIC